MSISDLDYEQIIQKVYQDSNNALAVNPISGLVTAAFDAITVAYPSSTQEVYSYRTGGTGGTVVATLTLNYVDSTKAQLASVAKS